MMGRSWNSTGEVHGYGEKRMGVSIPSTGKSSNSSSSSSAAADFCCVCSGLGSLEVGFSSFFEADCADAMVVRDVSALSEKICIVMVVDWVEVQ